MPISVRAEEEFARNYPVPQVTVADSLLTLWNYPVAKSDLAPEHQAALKAFVGIPFLSGDTGRGPLYGINVKGHASDTGDESANITLSRDRAEKVARFLRGENFPSGTNLPDEKITVEWVGSSEPDDPGATGLAAARNRRVDVLKIEIPSEPTAPPTPTPPPGPAFKYKPTFKSAPTFKVPAPTLSTGSIELKIPLKFPPLKTAEFTIGGAAEVILKLKASDSGGGVGGGVVFDAEGKLSAKVEAEIIDHVKSKIAVEPSEDGPGVKIKIGAELSSVPTKPEIGYSVTEAVIYVSFTFAEQPVDFEAGGVHFTGTIAIKGKVEVGPGPAVVLRAGAAAADAALVLSPVIVAGLILELEIVAIDAAEARQLEFARLIAIREGIAARVAYVLLGKAPVQDQYDARRLDWRKTSGGLVADFIAGADEVDRLTDKPDDLKTYSDLWKKKYAADNTQDFTTLRGRVFDGVGKYDTEGSLNDAVDMLTAE